jgi:FMN-dependent oxidoreductase (nitrilotriacetate monooxygenase family)
MFHLGWFLGNGYGIQPWHGPWSGHGGQEWTKPGLYVDLTTSLERAGFDFLFIEDTAMIEDTYRGSMETALQYGLFAPKNDPLPLVPLLAHATKHIGIISTMSTVQYPPYLAARLMTSLDHVTGGRAGINVVTSVTHRVAQNFGHDSHPEHDLRYEMAEEWMEVVSRLWESWDPGAVIMDLETPRYADHTKVHTIDFDGRFFKCRGPLNTVPGPQGRPVVGQAGASVPGRNLAARHADTMIAWGSSIESMKSFRQDMSRRVESFGRKPDDLKVLFLSTPVLGATDAEARAKVEAIDTKSKEFIESKLFHLSYASGGEIDFGRFDLDAPIPELVGNGEQSTISAFVTASRGKTLRQAITADWVGGQLDFVGSPDTVAAKMGDVMEEVGGDGYLLYPEMTRHAISEITDGLVPALQRRGLTRTSYTYDLFRDNLLEF